MESWLERDYLDWFNNIDPNYWFELSADKVADKFKLFKIIELPDQLAWQKELLERHAGRQR